MEERLQKVMARAGYGSRRANEELIEAGRVRVNGQTATLGMKADPDTDTITVDGKVLPKNMPNLIYIALNKPRGVLSDEDPGDDRTTVRDLIPVPGHLFAVGRLDYDSEGLILMTNDGELANRLTHPRYEHEKEYRVQVGSRPDEEQLAAWRRGVVLEDGHKTAPARIKVESQSGDGAWLTVVLKEGRKRQIRETGKQIGLPVLRIIRMRIGTLELGHLKPREWRNLSLPEVRALKQLSNREKAPHSGPRLQKKTQYKRSPTPRPVNTPEGPAHRETVSSRPPRPAGRPGRAAGSPTDRPARPYGGSDRPSRSSDRPARPAGRPARAMDRSDRSVGTPDRPYRSSDRPARSGYTTDRSERSSDRPARPARSSDRPARTSRPFDGPDRPSRSTDRPARAGYGTDRPDRSSDRPTRPAANSDRPYRSSDRPARPAGRPARPGNGTDRPARSSDRPARPSRSSDRPARPAGRPARPSGPSRSPRKK